jgi:hypothetical protein
MLFFFDHSIALLDMLAVKKNKATPMIRVQLHQHVREERKCRQFDEKRGGEGERSSYVAIATSELILQFYALPTARF